ncbi:MAG: cobalamin biosynthesis protein, partial [Chloroflexi bacterium]|nr:cobalamin biosynthesis protein [Chloroflexota bacterium]
DLYVSERLRERAPADARLFALPMGSLLGETFTAYDCQIFVVSVGAVVRMIAPLLQNKKVDPAVICVDDGARFSICVLSGHVGRGNVFTERVASILGAAPVVTTASDATGTLTVDILGRELGWTLDDLDRNVTRGCAAVVNAAPVVFVQECGEPDWWPPEKALPEGVRYATSLDDVDPAAWEVLLVATDREFRDSHPRHWANSVVYRPKSLVLGVGCDRGATPDMVERGVEKILAKHSLSPKCVQAVATIDKKRDEASILSLAERIGCPLRTFSAEELDRVSGIQNPSETVKFFVGSRGVAEPAALLAAGADRLLVPKEIYTEPGAGRSMTLAAARLPFAKRAAGESHV